MVARRLSAISGLNLPVYSEVVGITLERVLLRFEFYLCHRLHLIGPQKRVRPEDITLNLGKGAPIPKPNVPGNWGKIQHDSTVTWLANWVENVNNNHKYVFLAPGSSLKGQSDWKKFEKARKLKVSVNPSHIVGHALY
jgi:hypothetical protein